MQGFARDDCTHLAAASAFYIFLAIFPLAIFAAALSATLNRLLHLNLFDTIMNALTSILPPSARDAIRKPLEKVVSSRQEGLLSFGIATALWSASAAIGALITALNRAYHVAETRAFWKRKGLEILLTLSLSVLTAGAFALIVFGGRIGRGLTTATGHRTAFNATWPFVRWAIAVVSILGALAVLYWIGPNRRAPFRWLSAGAVLATLVWLLAINGFGIYVTRFGRYSVTYGTLGGVIVLYIFPRRLCSSAGNSTARSSVETRRPRAMLRRVQSRLK